MPEMRIERTPIEPTPEDATAAREQIMAAFAVLYPGWDFTHGVALAVTGNEHVALVSVGTAYDDAQATVGALLFAGQLGQRLLAGQS